MTVSRLNRAKPKSKGSCGGMWLNISLQTLCLDDSFHYKVERSVVEHRGDSGRRCASSGDKYWELVFEEIAGFEKRCSCVGKLSSSAKSCFAVRK